MTERYCLPWNTGLSSTDIAVRNRIGRLLDALANELNEHVVRGQIAADVREFRYQILCKLEADGWTISYDGGDRVKVREPGHRKPFDKRTVRA
jgi:hypothetical protein